MFWEVPRRFRGTSGCSRGCSSEKVFAGRERVSGFPETGADLRGTSGELPGKSGKLPGNPWIAVKFHSERTSGEVAEKLRGSLGNFQGSPGTFQKLGGA